MNNKDYSQLNEATIIQQVLAGHTQAYELLVKRYWKIALAIAYSRCQNSAAAEDIAQDSFIKAYQNLSTLRSQAHFAGWLIKIIHQECITHHRRQKSAVHITPNNIEQFHHTFAAKPNPGLTREQIDFVHQAIQKLPHHLQNVVIMRFVGGLPLRQIAEQVEKKYGTVRVWLHRAYKLLKEDLAPILEEVQS
jgi:RNA polymerase sigma-70 factor (ECF subfamily)